jgi:hypothetical protein
LLLQHAYHARLVMAWAVLREQKTPPSWVGSSSSDTYSKEGQTFSISMPSAANGKSFTAGFVSEVD